MAGLRFLISLKTQGTTHAEGDCLNVRLDGAPIGAKESKDFLVVDVPQSDFGNAKFADWNCAALYAKLLAEREAGEPHPVITHPFAVYEAPASEEIDDRAPPRMVKRSLNRINIDALSDKASVRDRSKDVTPKSTRDISTVKVAKPKDSHTQEEVVALKKEAALKRALGK